MWKYIVVYFVYQYTLLPQCESKIGDATVYCAVEHVDIKIDTCRKAFNIRKDALVFMDSLNSLNQQIDQSLPARNRPVLDSFKVNL